MKRDRGIDEQRGRKLRRAASRVKHDGGVLQRMESIHAQGGPEELQQAHTEGYPDLSSTVWDTLLLMASSPEVEAMRKQTQIDAEAVRQEGRKTHPRPTFRMAVLGHDQVPAGNGKRDGSQNSTRHRGLLEVFSPRRSHVEHRGPREPPGRSFSHLVVSFLSSSDR